MKKKLRYKIHINQDFITLKKCTLMAFLLLDKFGFLCYSGKKENISEVFMDYQALLLKKVQYQEALKIANKHALEKEFQNFYIEFSHNSTAIEGNTLTLLETKLILEDKISVGGKSLRELYEVINHHKATLFVEETVKKKQPLEESTTKDIHAMINENIFTGGIYRNEAVRITGASHKPPVGEEMFRQIKAFFSTLPFQFPENQILLSAWTHAEFIRIHPFIDGNGRTARQMLNYQLVSAGFPPISIPNSEKLVYYQTLDLFCSQGQLEPFADFIANLVEIRLDDFIGLTV